MSLILYFFKMLYFCLQQEQLLVKIQNVFFVAFCQATNTQCYTIVKYCVLYRELENNSKTGIVIDRKPLIVNIYQENKANMQF